MKKFLSANEAVAHAAAQAGCVVASAYPRQERVWH